MERLARVNQKAADQMQEFLDKHGYDNQDWITSVAYELATKYGEAAASVTCDLYDAIAETQGANVPAAEPAKTPTLQETKDVIGYAMRTAPKTVPAATGKLVKKTSTRTMRKNAARDNAMVALVPSGDGCVFCKMLGSRGWESARYTKSFEAHLHNNCRCEYVVRFGNNLRVAGYDPEALLKEFNDTGEKTWPEKMKAVRRKDEAEKREREKKEPLRIEAANPFKDPSTPLSISSYDQSKHFRGGKKYVEYMKKNPYEPSYLTISEEECQRLVDKYHGSGILQLDRKGNAMPHELIVDNDLEIGYVVNNKNGEKAITSSFKIHYSEKGTHIVPAYENQKQFWREKREQNGHDWLLRQKS